MARKIQATLGTAIFGDGWTNGTRNETRLPIVWVSENGTTGLVAVQSTNGGSWHPYTNQYGNHWHATIERCCRALNAHPPQGWEPVAA